MDLGPNFTQFLRGPQLKMARPKWKRFSPDMWLLLENSWLQLQNNLAPTRAPKASNVFLKYPSLLRRVPRTRLPKWFFCKFPNSGQLLRTIKLFLIRSRGVLLATTRGKQLYLEFNSIRVPNPIFSCFFVWWPRARVCVRWSEGCHVYIYSSNFFLRFSAFSPFLGLFWTVVATTSSFKAGLQLVVWDGGHECEERDYPKELFIITTQQEKLVSSPHIHEHYYRVRPVVMYSKNGSLCRYSSPPAKASRLGTYRDSGNVATPCHTTSFTLALPLPLYQHTGGFKLARNPASHVEETDTVDQINEGSWSGGSQSMKILYATRHIIILTRKHVHSLT